LGVENAPPLVRCAWACNPLSIPYHDREWGVPLHNDQQLFEFLVLEGAQAGLSWDTILRKRDRYRDLFDGFEPQRVASYDDAKLQALLGDPGIIRNRLTIRSAVTNAQAFLAVQREHGSFDSYIWQFTGGTTHITARHAGEPIPARTDESYAMSRDLKRRGFSFVGSTICYAFMQATGMVNDHLVECFRYRELTGSW